MAVSKNVKNSARHSVLICGSYGHGNAGDEAILESIVAAFRGADPTIELTVMSRTPEATEKARGVRSIYKFNIPSMLREMRRTGLYINGGGSLIQDVTSRRSLYYYLFSIMAAKMLGCRVIMYGCGIGPVTKWGNRSISRFIINRFADVITLREDDSLRELQSFKITRPKIIVASDPALTLAPAPTAEVDAKMAELGLDPQGKYLCIVPRMWTGFSEKAGDFAKCADAICEKYGLELVFLSIDHKNDALASEAIAKSMRAKQHILRDVLPARLAVGILSRMQAVISMRLHGLIFSAGQGVPLVGVSYDPKVTAFLHYIKQENFIRLEDVSAEKLTKLTESALALRDDTDALKKSVTQLRELEGLNLQSALELLNERRG